ncbi:MAG: DNA translocase FtsK [Coriobacteriales bacterium]|nr:DNA translocase FtsK [Coriobacteriales bacterium]
MSAKQKSRAAASGAANKTAAQKNNTKQSSKKKPSVAARTTTAQANAASHQADVQTTTRQPLLESRVRNDLVGVIIAVLAVALFVIVLFPSEAFGSRAVGDFLYRAFGIGAVVLPFLLLGWSVTFFLKRRLPNSPLRLALALGIIYVALISIFAVLTPQAASDPSLLFRPEILMTQGGYVGGAVAWALLSLVGSTIALIILCGFILVGLILIGLSITGLVERIVSAVKGEKRATGSEGEEESAMGQRGVQRLNGSAYNLGPTFAAGDASGGSGAVGGSGGLAAAGGPGVVGGVGVAGYGIDNPQMLPTMLRANGRLEHTMLQRQPSADGDLGITRRRTGRQGVFEDGPLQEPSDGPAGKSVGDGNWSGDPESREAPFDTTSSLDTESKAGALAAADTVLLESEGDRRGTDGSGQAALKTADKGRGRTGSLTGAAVKGADGDRDRGKQSLDGAPACGAQHDYELPSMKLLHVSREKANTKAGTSELRSTANRLQETLEEFGVDGSVVGWIAGPTVTLYKVSLGEGVRLNRVTALQDDIQLALAAEAIRIVAPIPGTSLVGIEVPNHSRNMVLLGDVLSAARTGPLALAIGKDVEGESVVADLSSMPHLLIGGTTGSGKSVAINSIIMSILMRTTPEQVRMIMIDPKRVELTLYNGIPHLYVPVVTDAGQAASALSWCVAEMDRRLKLFEKHAVKNIKQFNAKVADNLARLAAEQAKARAAQDALKTDEEGKPGAPIDANAETGEIDTEAVRARLATAGSDKDNEGIHDNSGEVDITVEQEELRATLPYLVIVIDELADLMMLNGKEVEATVSRLAQLARAAGLHLIVATQRPSTNVITGLIKANIVNRIAFTVASGIDSRVILDTPGAEDLIGLGDLLFSRPEYSKPVRIQGCFVSESEIETVVEFWRAQGSPDYHESIFETQAGGASATAGGAGSDEYGADDPLLWEAAEIVVSAQLGSTSTLQRRLKVGYARAGRIMDMLEMKGIVGPPNGSKPREVLIDDVLDLETLRAFG